MKVVVTGAGGQLGRDLVASCEVAGDEVIAFDRAALDIADAEAVSGTITPLRPDVVINCAAWTAVDACEADPERAIHTNADAVRYVRSAADAAGAHLVQISTDYVFDGRLRRPYRPDDSPNPMSVYGRSKRLGELRAGPDATIVRTSWVCGVHGHNMVHTVLRLLATHPTLRFVDDQIGNPSFTADLAPAIRSLAAERRGGIVHLTNATPDDAGVSWFESTLR